MDEIIELENFVNGQCVRQIHLMSNMEFEIGDIQMRYCVDLKDTLLASKGKEAGVWHYRVEQNYRGAIDIPAACKKGKVRRLVAWSLVGCPTVKVALYEAAQEFERLFGGRAQFGFMKKLPKGAEHGMEVGDLMLLEADWMLERCVAVGCKS